jgi:hypothetical protein
LCTSVIGILDHRDTRIDLILPENGVEGL